MPSFSRNLEETLHRAVAYANQRKHEYATLEHLLLSLTDDDDAAGVMRACDVDLAAVAMRLQQAQFAYNSSASVFNVLRGLSLLDVLK